MKITDTFGTHANRDYGCHIVEICCNIVFFPMFPLLCGLTYGLGSYGVVESKSPPLKLGWALVTALPNRL